MTNVEHTVRKSLDPFEGREQKQEEIEIEGLEGLEELEGLEGIEGIEEILGSKPIMNDLEEGENGKGFLIG